jgi:hypothetical protein
LEKIKMLKK